MKKLLLTAALSAAFFCTSALAAKTYTIKFAHVVAATTPKGKAADFFAKRAQELSNGELKVEVFPSATLIEDDRVFGSLAVNNVQMAAPAFSKFTTLAPTFLLFDLPFLFRDNAHLHAVEDGPVGQKIKDVLKSKGVIGLEYWDSGFKHFSSSKKPIVNTEDGKGQKMRIMSSKVLELQTKAMGANPQVLPFSEVYSALQQGVVDAAENPLSNFYNSKFHEVQSSLTLSGHGYLGYLVVVSEKFYNSLPEHLQKVLREALREATIYEREESAKEEAQLLAALQKYAKDTDKLEIIEISAEQKAAWQKLMEPIYSEFYGTVGKDLIEEALNTK